jgi:probable phosphoglycerate mutase
MLNDRDTSAMLPLGVTLYFVRHGETDWNRQQRYQGQTDIPLNATGRAQAARNGRMLRQLLGRRARMLDYVSSPLSRASETMAIIRRELGLAAEPFRRDDRLKEHHFGHWEGQLWSELPQIDPVGFAERQADTWNWTPRGGENYPMVSVRLSAWLAGIRSDTVAVSHGNVSRTLRGLLLALDTKIVPKLEVPQDRVLRLTKARASDRFVAEWL